MKQVRKVTWIFK